MTATGRQSVEDLERELAEHRRAEYRRLQRAAVTKAYAAHTGLVPDSFGTVEAFFARSFTSISTVDPSRFLTAAEVRRVLTATGS